jgi:hypothetical protein
LIDANLGASHKGGTKMLKLRFYLAKYAVPIKLAFVALIVVGSLFGYPETGECGGHGGG